MEKTFTKDLFILWFALGALICAALNLNDSLDLLVKKEKE